MFRIGANFRIRNPQQYPVARVRNIITPTAYDSVSDIGATFMPVLNSREAGGWFKYFPNTILRALPLIINSIPVFGYLVVPVSPLLFHQGCSISEKELVNAMANLN